MRPSGDGRPPPARAGGMPGGLPGGMPGGSKAFKRSKPPAWREAAELASEAARTEGASIPGEPSSRRAARSAIVATTLWPGATDLAAAAHDAEQAGPFLGMGRNQQPYGGCPAAAGEPRDGL